MTRPTIVIGLGGTGQWVLTFLKKELLEIGGGTLPASVKLVSFDTTSQTAAKTGQESGGEKDRSVKAGSVELSEGKEFIPIGGNVSQLATEIASGKHSHLQWFPAKNFLSKLPPAAFNTKEGSGQIRQMGRISIFRDLSALQKSEVLSRLRAAIQDLQKMVSRDSQLEIIIVGSLAGGTGAGMLIDIAILMREQAARLVQNNYVVRGFFVLPRAFTASAIGEGRDMLARSFAAWRELDRFMIVSERFGLRQINYHEKNSDLRIKLDRRAYDVSYMIDPARQTVNSLDNVKAEDGLFPAIAQVISAIVDEKAGKAYTEFVTTNLAGKLAQLPRQPYHSAVGSYTLKVPVYYAQEKFSHQLALEVLKSFLAPETNDKGRVVGVSDVRNREVPDGHVGLPPVMDFMSASALNISGKEIPNTKFLPMVANLRAREALREDKIIMSIARGGLTTRQSRFLQALTDISQDEQGKLIARNIDDELQIPIWRDVAPSRVAGDTPDQAYTRIKNRVPEIRSEHYGLDTVEGERLRGKYGKALEEAQKAQINRFKKLLHAWTLHTLNGESHDPHIARGGKVGYARAFYDELAQTFTYFNEVLNKVRQKRNEDLRLAARSKEAANRALQTYARLRSKSCFITFWDDFIHPDAHRSQRNYLQAEQRDIDIRKDDILLDVFAETAVQMKKITENTRDELDGWIKHLATGDTAIDIKGLYPVTIESLGGVNVNHELDKRLEKVSQIIGEHEYQSDPAFVSEALGSFRWEIENNESGLGLICGIDMPSKEPDDPPVYMPFRSSGDKPEHHNLNQVLKLAERPYAALHNERPLAKEIVKLHPTGRGLAEAVNGLAEPFYLNGSVPQGPEVVACYIRVRSDIDEETTAYFEKFEQEMKDRNPNIKGSSLTLVDSEDPHKLTILRSDDLLPSSDFDMWAKCRDAYVEQVTDPHRGIAAAELHIFPAEINACNYEAEMPMILGQDYRTLHPEVVALLEDHHRFRMFFQAYALGYLRIEESEDGQSYWAYQLPEDSEPLQVTYASPSYKGTSEDDIFQVIHNFVMEGYDQRPGMSGSRYIDWDKLHKAILLKQRDLGKSKLVKRYKEEIENPKGMVGRIRADVEKRRSQIADEGLRSTIGQEHTDLADLATVIYRKEIQKSENN
jgi:hypothetical protein